MTDPITGLLFAFGLGYAIFAWRDQRRAFLILWLVLGLAGSFLSSQHESPQSYRALTTLPAVVLLAADVLDRFARALYRWLKEQPFSPARLPVLAAGGLVLLSLSGSVAWEANTYFGRQAASMAVLRGFNPVENGVAREVITALTTGEEVYLSPQFSSYSPLRFLVYGVIKEKTGKNTLDDRPYQVILPEVGLPLPDHKRSALVLLDSDYWPLREYIASFYPQAKMDLVSLPDGSPLYFRIRVPGEQIASLQGLVQTISYADGRTEEHVVQQVAWSPADYPQASQVAWEGSLRLEHGGEYDLRGEGGLEVLIDDVPITGKHYFGRGLYRLRVVWNNGNTGTARLVWQAPGQDEMDVPADALFQVSGFQQGLLGTYWNNKNWEGQPVFQQVTPFLLLGWPDEQPIVPNGEFSARYTGLLQIAQAGTYLFRVQADDGARLILDGETLGESLEPGRPNDVEATIDLQPGQYMLEIDYFQQGGGSALRFYWATGTEALSPVPPSVLTPAEP